MATIWSTLSTSKKIIYILYVIASPLCGIAKLTYDPVEEERKEKQLLRNFRIEVREGWLSDIITKIQREKPLTDEEIELMYKDYAVPK